MQPAFSKGSYTIIICFCPLVLEDEASLSLLPLSLCLFTICLSPPPAARRRAGCRVQVQNEWRGEAWSVADCPSSQRAAETTTPPKQQDSKALIYGGPSRRGQPAARRPWTWWWARRTRRGRRGGSRVRGARGLERLWTHRPPASTSHDQANASPISSCCCLRPGGGRVPLNPHTTA